MHKIFLVAAHHVRLTAFWKPFLLSLVFGPPLIALGFAGMGWLLGDSAQSVEAVANSWRAQLTREPTTTRKVGYVDAAELLRDIPDTNTYRHFVRYAAEADAQRALTANAIASYYVIPRAYLTNGEIRYESELGWVDAANDALLERWLIFNLARAEGLQKAQRIAEPLKQLPSEKVGGWLPLDLFPFALTPAMLTGVSIAGIFLLTLMLMANVLLTPLAREKERHVLDVLLGSISPTQFLLGKFLGALLICAMQFVSWISWAFILSGRQISFQTLDATMILFIGLISISGFLLYAALFAVLSAWGELYLESDRIPFVIGIAALLPLLGLMLTGGSPTGDAATALSLIPFFAPTVMVWRILVAPVPFLQLAASVGLMWLATIFLLFVAVRWFERRVFFTASITWWRHAAVKKLLEGGARIVLIGTFVYVALRPHTELTEMDLWAALVSVCAMWLVIFFQRNFFSSWRALALLLFTYGVARAWLQWQWDLWTSANQNVNAFVLLLAVDTFAAILMTTAVLLVRRDVSVWALGVVWVGVPLIVLWNLARPENFAHVDPFAWREASWLPALMCLFAFLVGGGIVAFCAHFIQLLYLELAGEV